MFVTLGFDERQFLVADVGQALFLFNGVGAILPDVTSSLASVCRRAVRQRSSALHHAAVAIAPILRAAVVVLLGVPGAGAAACCEQFRR